MQSWEYRWSSCRHYALRVIDERVDDSPKVLELSASHSAAANVNSTPKAQYAYSEMSGGANHSRLTSMTYLDGDAVNDNSSSGLNDTNSRLSWDETEKCSDTNYALRG